MARYPRETPGRLIEKLIQIRLGLGLSQNGMLAKLGLDDRRARSSISSFERGASQPDLLTLLEYARAAGVCLDVIVDDKLDLPKNLPQTPDHEISKARGTQKRTSKR
jgi:transcriptional regulator with XRE-family HTH domain